MGTIEIKVIHPLDQSKIIEIGCPENILFREIFSQLVEADFLSSEYCYGGFVKPSLSRRKRLYIDINKTISEIGCANGDSVQIEIIADDVGESNPVPREESSGTIDFFGIDGIPKVSFSEMLDQKQSIIMVLHSYHNLEAEHRRVVGELAKIKQEGNDRKSAVLVNAVAGIVMSIGTAFIADAFVPAMATVCAGIITTAIGLWLGFKKQK